MKTFSLCMGILGALLLTACAQPSGIRVHGAVLPDENHPAALRDVAELPPSTMGATLNALFSFPEPGHQ